MRDKIILIVMAIFIVSLSGCIQSDTKKMDSLAPSINEHLKKGDNYYNTAAKSVNDYSIKNALSNCDNATSEFNLAKSSANEALTYAKNAKDNIFMEYLQDLISEIDAKLNATSELKQAAQYFQEKDNETANPHVINANQFMDKSIEYKIKRENMVKQNPSKFKQ